MSNRVGINYGIMLTRALCRLPLDEVIDGGKVLARATGRCRPFGAEDRAATLGD